MKIHTMEHGRVAIPPSRVIAVIDILRATTTIAAALDAGALSITPAASLTEARQLASPNSLLVGERKGLKVSDFALGNSPLEFVPGTVSGRHLIMTTTNGTRALRRALRCPHAEVVSLSLCNRSAVADWLQRLKAPSLTICCAGDDGRFSAEDFVGAGALIFRLRQSGLELELDDLSLVAEDWFESQKSNLLGLLRRTVHGRYLAAIGMEADLKICATLDCCRVVPLLREGRLQEALPPGPIPVS